MNFRDFNKLSFSKKLVTTWDKGQLLCCRQYENYRILLFSLNHFYIEMWIKRPVYLAVRVYGFKGSKLLFPYLNQINIEKGLKGYR